MSNVKTNELSPRPIRATHTGGCHCGAVRFEVALEPDFKGSKCNCSICAKTAAVGAIVKPNAFRLLSAEDALGGYQWGAKISTRHFCKHCGVHCFGAGHLEAIGGDFVSVRIATRHPRYPSWTPVQVYFRRTPAGWRTVGLDRGLDPK